MSVTMNYYDLYLPQQAARSGVLITFERADETPTGQVLFFGSAQEARDFRIAFAAQFQLVTGRPLFGATVDFVTPHRGGRKRAEA